MLLSRKTLRRILGVLWLIDGLLLLQPEMFTMNMVNGTMTPMLDGQPGLLAPGMQFIVNQTTLHLAAVNLFIAVVQILLGLGFLLLPDHRVKWPVIASIIWALIVWFGEEGMGMLFTGQASVLTGAPGAVLLYLLPGLAVYPRARSGASAPGTAAKAVAGGLLSRRGVRWSLAGFWYFAALLQAQPYWWHAGQIAAALNNLINLGGLNDLLVDPVVAQLSSASAPIETPLNSALIAIFLVLAVGLTTVKESQLRPVLVASIAMSVAIWYFGEALGMILTGMAPDFNSGLLLVVMALACWPRVPHMRAARIRYAEEVDSLTGPAAAAPHMQGKSAR